MNYIHVLNKNKRKSEGYGQFRDTDNMRHTTNNEGKQNKNTTQKTNKTSKSKPLN
jgi:hypothetical protein